MKGLKRDGININSQCLDDPDVGSVDGSSQIVQQSMWFRVSNKLNGIVNEACNSDCTYRLLFLQLPLQLAPA